jgi:hypothetical protein
MLSPASWLKRRLAISTAISVFCSCERMSRFMEPTATRRPSMTSSLVCSMAREAPALPPLEPVVPARNAERTLAASLRISCSSMPISSSALRWRA